MILRKEMETFAKFCFLLLNQYLESDSPKGDGNKVHSDLIEFFDFNLESDSPKGDGNCCFNNKCSHFLYLPFRK